MSLTFNVTYITMGHTENDSDIVEADSLMDLVEQLLDMWSYGDICITGLAQFLNANGIESPVATDDMDEFDPDEDDQTYQGLKDTAALICNLCHENPEKLAEFVAAIAPSVAIQQIAAETAKEEEDDE